MERAKSAIFHHNPPPPPQDKPAEGTNQTDHHGHGAEISRVRPAIFPRRDWQPSSFRPLWSPHNCGANDSGSLKNSCNPGGTISNLNRFVPITTSWWAELVSLYRKQTTQRRQSWIIWRVEPHDAKILPHVASADENYCSTWCVPATKTKQNKTPAR